MPNEDEDTSEHTVYWIGWIKHGHVQFLEAGPFASWDDADDALGEKRESPDYSRYEIVEQAITVRRRT